MLGRRAETDNRRAAVDRLRQGAARRRRVALWLPVFNHANTYNGSAASSSGGIKAPIRRSFSKPLPWEEALKRGYYLLDGKAG